MKKSKIISREKFLELKPSPGEMTEKEFMETPEGQKITADVIRHIEARRSLRNELNDGDDGYIDGWLTVSKRLGISPLEIQQMDSAEYSKWLAALVREKRREAKSKASSEETPHPYKLYFAEYCQANPSVTHPKAAAAKAYWRIKLDKNERKKFTDEESFVRRFKRYLGK